MSFYDMEPKTIDCADHIVAHGTLQSRIPTLLYKTYPSNTDYGTSAISRTKIHFLLLNVIWSGVGRKCHLADSFTFQVSLSHPQ